MSSAAFGETLQFITNVKLQELEKRRQAYVVHASTVLANAQKHDSDHLVDKVSVLLDGVKSWSGSWSADTNAVKNFEKWVDQAKRDPGFPRVLLERWVRDLEAQINHESTQYDYARLFGNLLTEWLKSSDDRNAAACSPGELAGDVSMSSDDGASSQDGFEKISRKETLEQKAKLESLIFEPKEIDVPALEAYLTDLFSDKKAKEALKAMRKRIAKFAEDLRRKTIEAEDMNWCIKSLLGTDLLSDEKRMTLKEFAENPTVVQELASVLNMQLASLSTWAWPKEGVAVEPRRHLNGKTRFFNDSEILTSLLLQYLGVKWSVEIKAALKEIYASTAWKGSSQLLSKTELERRAAFLGEGGSRFVHPKNIDETRLGFQKDYYFMSQLPSTVYSNKSYDDYNGEKETSAHGLASSGLRFDTPVDLKQSLLHLLSVDILLNKTLRGKCTVVRTDLEWFGPSLPFQSVLTVLKFFGMPKSDLQFIQSFLSCPIIFKDDPISSPRVRMRGIPVSHSLSTLCGELMLFGMDFAVNQRANGLFLHRIHDDFWFWDAEPKRCVDAWAEMQRYAALTGLKFNAEKTGAICVGGDGELHPELPRGDIRWGFLRMDAQAGGVFTIDQAMIDTHITELRRQLAAATSVFGWVQAYNKYLAFVVRNCGSPAKVYGRAHVDGVVAALARIQRALFPAAGGSFVDTVAAMLADKFGVHDVPLGWYLWPIAAGGLDVKDPLVDLLAMRADLPERPDDIFEKAKAEDERLFEKAKEDWESGAVCLSAGYRLEGLVTTSDPFFSFDEYVKGREGRSEGWHKAFMQLLDRPTFTHVEQIPKTEAALKVLGKGIDAFGSSSMDGWSGLSPYWKWVISLHHDEMVRKFGSLAIVEPTSIPVGMVRVFKGSRMRWEQ